MCIYKGLLTFIGSVCIASVFFCVQRGWLLWLGPTYRPPIHTPQQSQKEVQFFYRNNGNIAHESTQLLWCSDEQQNLHYLINSWLTFMYVEHHITKKVVVESTLINATETDIFISFSHKPFYKNQSIIEKLEFIQTLCATIAHVSGVTGIRFLVHHQPLDDPHLDCDISWPIALCEHMLLNLNDNLTISRNHSQPEPYAKDDTEKIIAAV